MIARPLADQRRTPPRRTATACAFVALLFVLATPTQAAPISASIEGCVSQLPGDVATWSSPVHFQFVAFWDPAAGCDPTIYQPIVVHAWFEDFDGTGGLKVQTLLDLFPRCGRIQFDAHSYISVTSNILDELGLVSLVFDTGVDCASAPPPTFTQTPPGPHNPGAPEPGAAALVATGAVLLHHLRRRWKGPA